MPRTLQELLLHSLTLPKDAIFFSLSQDLAELFPERAVAETTDGAFQLIRYASEHECEISLRLDVHSQMTVGYEYFDKTLWTAGTNCWDEVKWRGHLLEVITVTVQGEHCPETRSFVLGPNQEIAESFIASCCEWNSEIRGEVLVFNGGWQKDEELYKSISSTTLDSLVLEGDLKEQIRFDFRNFFESKEIYTKHSIPWKRGVLFLGPPGNGKTHAIKGLVNLLGIPCLYVRSLNHQYQTDQSMIEAIFSRARAAAPCVLIFEDLDSILNDGNRSFFLNELDGFASNQGIMTIATTNHPERLDPAILDRPSRFDRKYTFHLPEIEERIRYLGLQNEGLEETLRLDEAGIRQIALLTESFSFAYLKELVLSAMMKWISDGSTQSMVEVMIGQVDSLKSQMLTPEPEPDPQGRAPRRLWR